MESTPAVLFPQTRKKNRKNSRALLPKPLQKRTGKPHWNKRPSNSPFRRISWPEASSPAMTGRLLRWSSTPLTARAWTVWHPDLSEPHWKPISPSVQVLRWSSPSVQTLPFPSPSRNNWNRCPLPPPPSTPEAAPKSQEPQRKPAAPVQETPPRENDAEDSYYTDPLIDAAMEIFRARIISQ